MKQHDGSLSFHKGSLIEKLYSKVKKIDGLPLVARKVIRIKLGNKKFNEFVEFLGKKEPVWYKDYSWCNCPTCGTKHLDKSKFVRYAYFWHLEEFLRTTTVSKIKVK